MFTTHKIQGAGGVGGADSYWIALAGGTGTDYAWGADVDSGGNIIVSGYSNSVGAGSYDAIVLKYDPDGAIQVSRALGGTGFELLRQVATDSSDNIITVGQTDSVGVGSSDMLIAKYNSSGTLQWTRRLGGASFESYWGVVVDSSDNIYACGFTSNAGAGGNDVIMVKYNSSGTLQWQKTYGNSSNQSGYGAAIDSSDDVIQVGYDDGYSPRAGLILKRNSSGTLQWARALYHATDIVFFGDAAVDSSDNIYVVGNSGTVGQNVILAKYNSSGGHFWTKTLTGTSNGNASYAVAVDDATSSVYLTADIDSGLHLVKYNTSGTLQWQRSISGAGVEAGHGLTLDASGNPVVIGRTDSDGAGGTDIVVARLPADGSGTGTYGSLTYAASSLTASSASYTNATVSYTDGTSSLTDAAAVLTDQSVTLTEELFEVTP